MRFRPDFFAVSAFLLAAVLAAAADAQSYRIERIASGLNQPSYVTQAPGDPANILYFTERTSNTIGGFGSVNQMGKVWRYDVDTRTKQLVLDFSSRQVINDTGLHTIAFHPDFNNLGATGYQKMYVTLSEWGPTALNKLEEYRIGADGTATLDRIILQYGNNSQNNHTINWVGFDPTANGDERNYLYISTGDGSFGNNYNEGISPAGRPSQNPADVRGKILRVDVDPTHPDAYPSDSLKNFAIPATNPVPTYNAAHLDSPLMGSVVGRGGRAFPAAALGEVYVTGIRNAYRASFDRETGDLWMGDVGEFFAEEVGYLKTGSNTAGPPVDYGWPQREGIFSSGVSSAPHTTTNPFTGANSLEPLQQFLHDGGGEAVIGGYVYRGPVAELQGKYFYADFVTTGNANQLWALDFNRDTAPVDFNGSNGTNTDISALWQSLVVDPTDPSYLPNSTADSSTGLDHIVSFGEDNAGNLYLVDFGNGAGFNGQYPGAGLGEIFRVTSIVPEPATIVTALIAAAFGLSVNSRKTASAKNF